MLSMRAAGRASAKLLFHPCRANSQHVSAYITVHSAMIMVEPSQGW